MFRVVFLIMVVVIIACVYFLVFHRDGYKSNLVNDFFLKEFSRFPDPIVLHYLSKQDNNFIAQYLDGYKKETIFGREYMKSKRLVIAGLIRNCEYNIPFIQKMYEQIKPFFQEVMMVFVENDSTDKTREKLLAWAEQNANIIVLCEDYLYTNQDKCTIQWADYSVMDEYSVEATRIGRLSKLRNVYLNYVKNQLNLYDFMMVIDFDLTGHLFMDGVFHTFAKFSQNVSINMISCNGLVSRIGKPLFYYDSFAYVDKDAHYIFKTKAEKTKHDAYVNNIINKKYATTIDLDPVFSAFGGCCFYRVHKILNPRIKYDYERSGYACEHSFLNKNITNCFVNPKLIFIINNHH